MSHQGALQPFRHPSSSSISVIVCAYTEQRWDDLLAAIASLEQQTHSPDEIILVIDHNEALLQRAQAQFTDVILLSNRHLKGLSGARNTGIAAATSMILAFMDEDAVAEEHWCERLLAHFADPTVTGVGGAILPLWSTARPAWFPEEFNWVVGCTYKGMATETAPVRNLIGCNMAYRRSAFEQAGGFREGIGRVDTIPVGCEETELCIRIHQCQPSSVLLYDPAIQVQHRVPAARANWGYFRSRCYAEGFSKALISQFVGTDAGLASERSYTIKTLPRGVLGGLGAALQGDLAGLSRAAAITAGLLITASGYLKGKVHFARAPLQLDSPPALGD